MGAKVGILMNRFFKFIKVFLIILLMIAVLNDVLTYLYVFFIWGDHSSLLSELAEIFAFAFAGYLAYRDNVIADFISSALALESLNTIYQINYVLFSWGFLKIGPQVLFSNILMTTLLIVSLIHFILLIIRKAQRKNTKEIFKSKRT